MAASSVSHAYVVENFPGVVNLYKQRIYHSEQIVNNFTCDPYALKQRRTSHLGQVRRCFKVGSLRQYYCQTPVRLLNNLVEALQQIVGGLNHLRVCLIRALRDDHVRQLRGKFHVGGFECAG